MLSATIGAQSAALPIRGAEAKPEIPAQHFDSAASSDEAAEATSSATPTVPANSSAQISVEAVTALQQVEQELAVGEQRLATEVPQNDDAVVELGVQNEEGDGLEAATAEVQELEEEAAQSRSNSSDEIAVGEETDAAGRSVRNPLDLQI
jgi:hypothetical protein